MLEFSDGPEDKYLTVKNISQLGKATVSGSA